MSDRNWLQLSRGDAPRRDASCTPRASHGTTCAAGGGARRREAAGAARGAGGRVAAYLDALLHEVLEHDDKLRVLVRVHDGRECHELLERALVQLVDAHDVRVHNEDVGERFDVQQTAASHRGSQ